MMQPIAAAKTEKLWQYLQGGRHIVITTHARPDGDAVGSATAMLSFLTEAMGKDAALVFPTEAPENLQFIIPSHLKEKVGVGPAAGEAALDGCDLLICLDFNCFSRTEALQDLFASARAAKILIDHHVGPDEAAFDLVFSETAVSSASELLFHILKTLPPCGGDASRLPAGCATALMAGMTTDTNNFGNSVYPSTFAMASDLLAAGVDRERILDEIYHTCPETRIRLMGHVFEDLLSITPEGAAYIVLRKADLERFNVREGDTEGFVNIPLTIRNVRLSAFIKEDDGFFRVSLRSRRDVSARQLALKYFHGGGHEQAAGGKILLPDDIPSGEALVPWLDHILKTYLS